MTEERIAALEEDVRALTFVVVVLANQVAEPPGAAVLANEPQQGYRFVRPPRTRQEMRDGVESLVAQFGLSLKESSRGE